jgi:hypothetical protein
MAQRALGLGRPHTKFEKLLRRELPDAENFHLDTKHPDDDGRPSSLMVQIFMPAQRDPRSEKTTLTERRNTVLGTTEYRKSEIRAHANQ